jgi:hypothetical protein
MEHEATERLKVTVTLWIRIREVLDSNLDRDIDYGDWVFVVFPSPTIQMPEQCLDWARIYPFQFLNNLQFCDDT